MQIISLLQSCPSNISSPLLMVLSIWNTNPRSRQSGWNGWHNFCYITSSEWINIGYDHYTRPLGNDCFCFLTEWSLHSFAQFIRFSNLTTSTFLGSSSPKHTDLFAIFPPKNMHLGLYNCCMECLPSWSNWWSKLMACFLYMPPTGRNNHFPESP